MPAAPSWQAAAPAHGAPCRAAGAAYKWRNFRTAALSIYDENRVLRILRYLGPIAPDRFHDRLRLQRLAFLIQEMGGGGPRPFSYYWYIRGPFSPLLTQMLYSGDEVGAYEDAPELTAAELMTARKVQALMGNDMDDIRQLELYASVSYLAPHRPLSEDDKASIISRMESDKPHYKTEDVRAALDRIEVFRGHA